MTKIKIGDKVRYTNEICPDWVGQEGVVIGTGGLIEYRITKPVPEDVWGEFAKDLNKVGNTVNIHCDSLTVINDEEPRIKVGDTVRYADNGSGTHWIGQEGVVTSIDEDLIVTYRITKAAPKSYLFTATSYNTVGEEVRLREHKLEVIKSAEPEAKFKVGDVVRLTKKGGKQNGMEYLHEGMQATLTRVHWYFASEEWGYKMEIPGITDDYDLGWVKEYEFYEGDFVLESSLKDATLKDLKKAKPGTVVWDEDGDKWVRVSSKKQDAWVFIREGSADLMSSVFIQSSEELRSSFAPISFIKP